jgi:hypothetical protein
MLQQWSAGFLFALATLAAAPLAAHHSFAAYDVTRIETIRGTVREFQWVNPHTWIYVTVVDAKGVAKDYGFEGGPVVGLKRAGWSKETFKAGDNVSITFRPRKDGVPGGGFLQGVTASGKTIGELNKQLTTVTAPAPVAPTTGP